MQIRDLDTGRRMRPEGLYIGLSRSLLAISYRLGSENSSAIARKTPFPDGEGGMAASAAQRAKGVRS